MTKLQEAIEILSEELRTDEDYRRGWVANIAVAMHDEYYSHGKQCLDGETLHKVFNDGAERFIKLLTYKPAE